MAEGGLTPPFSHPCFSLSLSAYSLARKIRGFERGTKRGREGRVVRVSVEKREVIRERQLQPQRQQQARILDPSDKYRPEPVYAGKLKREFRDYSEDRNDPVKERVRKTYQKMHSNQTVEFVRCE